MIAVVVVVAAAAVVAAVFLFFFPLRRSGACNTSVPQRTRSARRPAWRPSMLGALIAVGGCPGGKPMTCGGRPRTSVF